MTKYTPMMQQYLRIKAEVPDAFLFFRLGDFYEMFFDDALKASKELEITLTARGGNKEDKIPMCGVPYHSAAAYIEKLVDRGYKVALCEQTEDPKHAKGVVKREIVQMITPGTAVDAVNEKENHFLGSAVKLAGGRYSIAYLDLSTGESKASVVDSEELLLQEVSLIRAKELILTASVDEELIRKFKDRGITAISKVNSETLSFDESLLSLLEGSDVKQGISLLLHYTADTQKRSLDHLQKTEQYEVSSYLQIDPNSKRNLELTENNRSGSKKGSLVWLLDETVTAMGSRQLKSWIERPLINQIQINERLGLVESLKHYFFERESLRELLQNVYDLERLAGRVAFGSISPRDLVQLKKSLQQVPFIKEKLNEIPDKGLMKRSDSMDACADVAELLDASIDDQAPITIKDGNFIKDGYSEELDQYKDASRNGKKWIAELEQKERSLTGIKSLKIGYNRIFGYYIEVTKANLSSLNDDRYERRQTLANAERYITPELKEKETLILEAEEKSVELEHQIFQVIKEQVKNEIPRIQKLAKDISEIDVLQAFAYISEKRHYVKPVFSEQKTLNIKEGRHPVIEKVMDLNEYVPNSCKMDADRSMLLITGPNMSGKSTYMRQVALISVMAQMGCFVPAEYAELPIFDRIFTRIGAADDLVSGQSTFMVEMLEAKHALEHATENSLILFDEIGRGTSTYDGMSLAQAIIEYVHDSIQAKTLFSTHYHELVELSSKLKRLKNIHVAAAEQDGRVIFLHKVKEGPADKSYGIHVAELAELPASLISRANELLSLFEAEKETGAESRQQMTLFDLPEKPEPAENKVLKEIQKINVLEMTPMEAMNELYRLQKRAGKMLTKS
ncbi:DNA mismatch repair protein MutS [Jeotgalibacillus haloalkalitolerans]|uniref:DNA mismatch repair protein MutS n=1 Tax=Jeotgalibacillus haloalkalitolerans TaxID=3104292 RepID=A0ABU5KKM1_9BACL|nr:DNA mismatch repair protein MutS [Jeotgalibacillus sp. HH7-29]MDZ5711803.1 DNA mismatch repair protein MutS [Jeotgalibacillus sp. HH7-29]